MWKLLNTESKSVGFAFTWKLEAWFQVVGGQFTELWFTLLCWFELPSVSLGENGSWKEPEAVLTGSTKGLCCLFLELKCFQGLAIE